MSITPEIEAEILQLLDQNPTRFSPFRAAKKVGATTGEVIAFLNSRKAAPSGPYDGQLDRTRLAPFVVASRRVTEPGWDNTLPEVAAARAAFEAGTHDMATHRQGKWLHLCLFPLVRRRKARPGYFLNTGKR